jgi:hypothetical protein
MPWYVIFWKFEFEQVIFSSGLLSQYIAGTDMFSVMLPNDSTHLNSKVVMLPNDSTHLNSKVDSPWKKRNKDMKHSYHYRNSKIQFFERCFQYVSPK